MENSAFTPTATQDADTAPIIKGSTCVCQLVKLYGKLHFRKQLKPEYADDPRYRAALHKEFSVGYTLEHPNLVHYISEGDGYVLMEYVDGETLEDFLLSNPGYFKSRTYFRKFISQLLDVVSYLHAHQVVHLDLKPSNILITRVNHDVKLIDLGYCHTDAFPDTGGMTASFAAPEQLAKKQVDERTDIFAIGRILSEVAPSQYNKVVRKCTMHEPKDRYQSIEELRHALFHRSITRYIVGVAVVALLAIILATVSSQQPSPTVVEKIITTDKTDTTKTHHIVTPGSTKAGKPVQPKTPSTLEVVREEARRLVKQNFAETLGTYRDSVMTDTWNDLSLAYSKGDGRICKQLQQEFPDRTEMEILKIVNEESNALYNKEYNRLVHNRYHPK